MSGGNSGLWAVALVIAAGIVATLQERRRDRAKAKADALEAVREKPVDDAKRDAIVVTTTRELLGMQQQTIERMQADIAALTLRCAAAEAHANACELQLAVANTRISEQAGKIADQARQIAQLELLVAANTAAQSVIAKAQETAHSLSTAAGAVPLDVPVVITAIPTPEAK